MKKSVLQDIFILKNNPLVLKSILIYGYIFDCKTGNLIEVKESTKVEAENI